jgi:GH24 family phage-related lysozyme (muramidase)
MPLTPEGWTLLKTWEGCRLSAYPDPASGGAPWTIGHGHTGPESKPSVTISQEQADAWLEHDVHVAATVVQIKSTSRQKPMARANSAMGH